MKPRVAHTKNKTQISTKERNVLSVVGTLALTEWINKKNLFLNEILAWVKNRVQENLPSEAYEGRSFSLPKGGRSIDCVSSTFGSAETWGMRFDDPDDNVPGRV